MCRRFQGSVYFLCIPKARPEASGGLGLAFFARFGALLPRQSSEFDALIAHACIGSAIPRAPPAKVLIAHPPTSLFPYSASEAFPFGMLRASWLPMNINCQDSTSLTHFSRFAADFTGTLIVWPICKSSGSTPLLAFVRSATVQ